MVLVKHKQHFIQVTLSKSESRHTSALAKRDKSSHSNWLAWRSKREVANIQHVNPSSAILATSQQCVNPWISILCFSCQATFKEAPRSFIKNCFLECNTHQCHCRQVLRAIVICSLLYGCTELSPSQSFRGSHFCPSGKTVEICLSPNGCSGVWVKRYNEKCSWTVPQQPHCLANDCPIIIIFMKAKKPLIH